MALAFQLVRTAFRGGQTNSKDPYLLQAPSMPVLTDAVFDNAETFIQRPGYHTVNIAVNDTVGGTKVVPGQAVRLSKNGRNVILETLGGFRLVSAAAAVSGSTIGSELINQNNVFAGNPDEVQNDDAAPGYRVGHEAMPLGTFSLPDVTAAPTGEYNFPFDIGYWPDIDTEVRAFQEYVDDGSSQVRLQVALREDNVVLLEKTYVGYANPRVLAGTSDPTIGWLYFTDVSANIKVVKINVSSEGHPSVDAVSGTVATASSGYTGDTLFDAIVLPTTGLPVLIYKDAPNSVRISAIGDNAGVTENYGQSFVTADDAVGVNIIYAQNDSNAGMYGFYQNGTDTANAVALFEDGTFVTETVIYTAAAGLALSRIVGISTCDDGAHNPPIVFFIDTESAYIQRVAVVVASRSTLSASDITTTYAPINTLIYAKPQLIFTNANSTQFEIYLPTYNLSHELRSTLFVYHFALIGTGAFIGDFPDNPNVPPVVARLAYENIAISDGELPAQRVPNTYVRNTNTLFNVGYLRFPRSIQEVSPATTDPVFRSLWRAELDPYTPNLGFSESNGLTVLGGALPLEIDGETYFEAGFNNVPEILGPAASGTTSGSLEFPGTYQVCCTYGWRDARGNLHESQPGDLKTFSTSDVTQGYTFHYLHCITNRPGVVVRVYRTQNLLSSPGSSLYLDGEFKDDNTTDTSVFIKGDGTSAGASIPTDGGVLPNFALPEHRYSTTFQERLFFFGCDDGYTVNFTNPRDDDFAPEYNSFFSRTVPREWGRVVTGVAMDEKLILFCENEIGFIYGNGPNRTGSDDNYSQPTACVAGYGVDWTSGGSVIKCDNGIYFLSQFGYRLLTRQLSIARNQDGTDWGNDQDDTLKSRTNTKAVLGRCLGKQQLRIYCPAIGQTLATVCVYDLNYNQWSEFTNHYFNDAIALGDFFYFCGNLYDNDNIPAPYLCAAIDSDFDDVSPLASTAVSLRVMTPWYAFAGIQGFQRVTHMLLMGRVEGGAGETVALNVEIQNDYTETNVQTTPISQFVPSAPAQPEVQVGAQLQFQKCEALRFHITGSSGFGSHQRLRLTSLTLRVGLKKGRYHGGDIGRI